MITFGISKELVATLRYYYEKKQKRIRNHSEISVFQSSIRVCPRHLNLKLF